MNDKQNAETEEQLNEEFAKVYESAVNMERNLAQDDEKALELAAIAMVVRGIVKGGNPTTILALALTTNHIENLCMRALTSMCASRPLNKSVAMFRVDRLMDYIAKRNEEFFKRASEGPKSGDDGRG